MQVTRDAGGAPDSIRGDHAEAAGCLTCKPLRTSPPVDAKGIVPACARSGPVSKFVREHAFCAPSAAGSRERARVATGGSGLNSQLGALVLEEDAAQMDMTLGVQTECRPPATHITTKSGSG